MKIVKLMAFVFQIKNNDLFLAGFAIACLVILTIVISPLCFLTGLPYSFSFILSFLLVLFFLKKTSNQLNVFFIVLGCTLLSFFIAGIFYDFSCDGRIHFQETIIQLNEGWDFFHQDFPFDKSWWGWPWANDYPLGMQFFAVSVFDLFKNIQLAKAYLFFMLFACFLMSSGCLFNFYKNKLFILLFSFSIIFNPIVIGQLWTFYVDGFIYLVFLSGILCIYKTRSSRIKQNEKTVVYLYILFSISILSAIKLSGTLYSAILFVCFLCADKKAFKHKFRLFIPFLIVLLIVCYRPYLDRSFSSVFAIIRKGEDVFPIGLNNHLPIIAFIKNLFCSATPTYKEIHFGSKILGLRYDTSFGLYGVFWGCAFLLSLWPCIKNIKKDNVFLFLLILILPPLLYRGFINQRYYSALYIFPFLVFLLSKEKVLKNTGIVLLSCHIVFLSFGIWSIVSKNIRITSNIKKYIEQINSNPDKPLYLEFQRTDLDGFWAMHTLSDRLWAQNENTFILNHIYNINKYSSVANEKIFINKEIMQNSVEIDLRKQQTLSILEVFVDDKCSCAVSVFFQYEQKETEPGNTVFLFVRSHDVNYKKLLFAIPPNGTMQVQAPCRIKKIIVKNGDAIQLIPLTPKINQKSRVE